MIFGLGQTGGWGRVELGGGEEENKETARTRYYLLLTIRLPIYPATRFVQETVKRSTHTEQHT